MATAVIAVAVALFLVAAAVGVGLIIVVAAAAIVAFVALVTCGRTGMLVCTGCVVSLVSKI